MDTFFYLSIDHDEFHPETYRAVELSMMPAEKPEEKQEFRFASGDPLADWQAAVDKAVEMGCEKEGASIGRSSSVGDFDSESLLYTFDTDLRISSRCQIMRLKSARERWKAIRRYEIRIAGSEAGGEQEHADELREVLRIQQELAAKTSPGPRTWEDAAEEKGASRIMTACALAGREEALRIMEDEEQAQKVYEAIMGVQV